MSKKIIVTGGSGRFGNILRNYKTNHRILFPGKKELNILNVKSIEKYLVLEDRSNFVSFFTAT